jgi:hypothetical protein
MRYADYDRMVYSEEDILKYKNLFEKEIVDKQKELSEFLNRANERVKCIKEWEENKRYKILGSTYRTGKEKRILLIIRYEDGTQKDERYKFDRIGDLRSKLLQLKEIHSGVDWNMFREEI